jgi:hypothetical protein
MSPDAYRSIVVGVILACFVWLGLHDIARGEVGTGIASLCLAAANYLLLV